MFSILFGNRAAMRTLARAEAARIRSLPPGERERTLESDYPKETVGPDGRTYRVEAAALQSPEDGAGLAMVAVCDLGFARWLPVTESFSV